MEFCTNLQRIHIFINTTFEKKENDGRLKVIIHILFYEYNLSNVLLRQINFGEVKHGYIYKFYLSN
jgi:hypothetical protein